MSNKQNKKGRTRGGPPYVQLFHWIRQTGAWRSLAPYSRLLYVEIRGRYNGSNNGDISMSYREAEELLGCSNGPIIIAFRELQDRGFIVPVQLGSFDWKRHMAGAHRATTWRLTELPQDIPERTLIPSYEFKSWVPSGDKKKKTRREKITPMTPKSHAIEDAMTPKSHANGVKISPHSGEIQGSDGVKISRTNNIPYTSQPIGQVSTRLLNSRLIQNARRRDV